MPWKETCIMDERMEFVAACLSGEDTMTALCERHGISRKTGYKLLGRYRVEGPSGVEERSRRPHRFARAIGGDVAAAIVNLGFGVRGGVRRSFGRV